jgi:hypothetical protein
LSLFIFSILSDASRVWPLKALVPVPSAQSLVTSRLQRANPPFSPLDCWRITKRLLKYIEIKIR